MIRLLLLVPFCASLFADPITIAILNQTDQVTAQTAVMSGVMCNDNSTLFATCSLHGPQPGEVATASASIDSGTLSADTSANLAYSTATASMTDTVLISGGTGTGYLNLVFGARNIGPYSQGESLGVNGQYGQFHTDFAPDEWGIFSFQFNQPFTYTISLYESTGPQDTLDSGQVSLYAARIYTIQPTDCGLDTNTGYYGVCLDPNFASANELGSAIPEPGTIWLAAGALLGLIAIRGLTKTRC